MQAALTIGSPFAEQYTSGKVSASARRAWREHPNRSKRTHVMFEPIRDGYMMHAWESEIDYCRAMGRGDRSGRGMAQHPFDKEGQAFPRLRPIGW
jgi:hypothetical protein